MRISATWVFFVLVFSWNLLASRSLAEPVQPVNFSVDKVPKAPTWLLEGQPAPTGQGLLTDMRAAFEHKKYLSCVSLGDKAAVQNKNLAPWILRMQLICANEALQVQSSDYQDSLPLIEKVKKNSQWLAVGAQRASLKKEFLRNLTLKLAREGKDNRLKAWRTFQDITEFESELSADDRAEAYRIGGELAFVEQRLEVAKSLFEQSLRFKANKTVSERLSALRATLGEPPPPEKSPWPSNSEVEFSAEELALFSRMSTALRAGDLLASVDDGLQLLRDYPSGKKAENVMEKITENLFSLLGKDDERLTSIREKYLRMLQKAHPSRQLEWARKCLAKGYYSEALLLAENAYLELEKSPQAGSALEVAAKSAWHSGNDKLSKKYFTLLSQKSAGTTLSGETLFALGLWEFRNQNYTQAAFHLERLLMTSQGETHELSARYWLWRALQKAGKPSASEQAQVLMTKFPFSYYGLRTRAEVEGQLTWTFKPQKLQTKLYFTTSQLRRLKQAEDLIKNGWWEEAQLELRELPQPTRAESKAIWAFYHAAALDFPKATQLINDAWDQMPTLRDLPFVQVAFPKQLEKTIAENSKNKMASPLLVRSLIKQESAFFPQAVSSSGAIGLMQLLPATAQEVATNLNDKKTKVPEDVFKPDVNVRLGTTYIQQMLQKFDGHVPLALAAYNAGPTRLQKWMKNNERWKNLSQNQSSKPEDEIWFEEMPWTETRGYVKSILRNAMIYQLIDKGRVELAEPLWKTLIEKSSTP